MIVVMKPKSDERQVNNICEFLTELGLQPHVSKGSQVTIIGVIGDKRVLADKPLEVMPGVDKLVTITDSFKLASRTFKSEDTVVDVGGALIGGGNIALMAGPCAVESREQLLTVAKAVKKSGAQFLRGGAYKPRTSPYAFQGLEEEGLKIMHEAKQITGLRIVTEIISPEFIEVADKYADVFQIGARNMQNFQLLREVGRTKKPVLLKRGLSATVEEWINAAEYIMSGDNFNVILCERGIRTFETATRNTLDLGAVAVAKAKTHLPVIVDPSHALGKSEYVLPLSRAAIAAGADGLIIEVHPSPVDALSDGRQSLTPEQFDSLCKEVKGMVGFLGEKM